MIDEQVELGGKIACICVEKITMNVGMCISFGFKLIKKTNKKD